MFDEKKNCFYFKVLFFVKFLLSMNKFGYKPPFENLALHWKPFTAMFLLKFSKFENFYLKLKRKLIKLKKITKRPKLTTN